MVLSWNWFQVRFINEEADQLLVKKGTQPQMDGDADPLEYR